MLQNYWGQLIQTYPKKAEMLEWMKYALDNRVYYFGQHFKTPYEARPMKVKLKARAVNFIRKMKTAAITYNGAVISNAYFNVSEFIRKEGYSVILPPWQTGNISKESQETLYQMMFSDFNKVLSDNFQNAVYKLRDELKQFFVKNHTPFVLLSNDLDPIHRITIDICKEINIPSGVFLHGLPASYNSIDDSRADYLFVWGEKIKENYINAGSKSNIVVTGHPNFSSFKTVISHPENVVVISRAVCGAPSQSDRHSVDDRGICIQHIYAIETALKNAGINHAILRLHPSENPDWYAKFMDKDFYSLDTHSLDYTISHAKMVVGQISTVMLNTVFNNIPCYPFVLGKEENHYASEIVPPFSNMPGFPTSCTVVELADNINNGRFVTSEHFDGYVNPSFEVSKITQYIQSK